MIYKETLKAVVSLAKLWEEHPMRLWKAVWRNLFSRCTHCLHTASTDPNSTQPICHELVFDIHLNPFSDPYNTTVMSAQNGCFHFV